MNFSRKSWLKCVELLHIFVEQLVFGYSLWWKGAIHDHLPLHRSSENRLDNIDKVLFLLKRADPFGVVRSSGIHLHVVGIEEEDGRRDQSDVEIPDVDLNFLRIGIDKRDRGELGDLPRRFGENVVEEKASGIGGAAEAEDEDFVDGGSDDGVHLLLLRQCRQYVTHDSLCYSSSPEF